MAACNQAINITLAEFAAASASAADVQMQPQLANEAKAKQAAYNKAAYDKRKLAKLTAASATGAEEQVIVFYEAIVFLNAYDLRRSG